MTGTFAQVGFGYWGPNLSRNLGALAKQRWRYLVDLSPARREQAASLYPQVNVIDSVDAVLADPEVSAVVISTPAATHADLARRALAAGKHAFVEKPLALSAADAIELATLADQSGLVLMVGHTFEFVPAVRKMKELVDAGEIGDVLYLHSQRLNLGRIQSDINAFWSIGPHDVSIANYLLGSTAGWVVRPRRPVPARQHRGRHLRDRRLPRRRAGAHARELARPVQDPPHHRRGQPEDARLRRPGRRGQAQGLRQGRRPPRRRTRTGPGSTGCATAR